MRLLGAKKFLDSVNPGTLFVQFWERSVNDCKQLIKDFESGENIDLVEKYQGDYYIFGDNSGSLSFTDDEDGNYKYKNYNCLLYTDLNIVGDASPRVTLYLVFDTEDEYPDKINIGYKKWLTKDEIVHISEYFVSNEIFFNTPNWVCEYFNDNINDEIINYQSVVINSNLSGIESYHKLMEIYGNTGSLEGTYQLALNVKRDLEYADKCHKLEEELGCSLGDMSKALISGIKFKEGKSE